MTETRAGSAEVPLVVDLDGTLIATDVLFETASVQLIRSPRSLGRMLRWLMRGRAHLKKELVARTPLDVTTLPFRDDLVAWLHEEKESGRRLVLASAADGEAVRQIATYLDIFDDVFGSGDGVNLRSEAKRRLLVERYGEGGFDYVGNSSHDLPVWTSARTAHVVAASDAVLRRAGQIADVGRVFESPRRGRVRAAIAEMRPHQWAKNALVLVPLLMAHLLHDGHAVVNAVLAGVSFCLTASSVYVFNDLADLANDRHHPTKRRRPFASGGLSLEAGWVMWPVLAVLGIAVALLLPWRFIVALLAYLALTLAYTLWLKRQPVFDVVVLACLYTARIIAGAAAVGADLSMWLLTFSIFLFLGLALIKRVSELTRVRRQLSVSKGRGYHESDLELLAMVGVASSIASVVIFALYVNDPVTSVLYNEPTVLWATVPVLLAWLMRMWLTAHRGEMDEDPIIYALRDWFGLAAGVAVAVVFVLASVLP